MKYLHTFSQHINESQSLPSGVEEIDRDTYYDLWRKLDRENLGDEFTEEEKTKLDGVRQLLGFQRFPNSKYFFVMAKEVTKNGTGVDVYSPPAAWFTKLRSGEYLLSAIFDGEPNKHYTSKSLDSLIPLVMDLTDIKVEWDKIK